MLHLHRSERTDVLADALGALLLEPLPDAFATEVVAVPARGVERWLVQRLSHVLGAGGGSGDGVCAGVDLPSTAALVRRALHPGGRADDDPWDGSLWSVLEVLDDSRDEPWCAVLQRWLGAHDPPGSHRPGRRWATAAHLAELFRAYGAHRPQVLRDWAQGRDTDVPDDLAWQPELWRRVRERLGDSPAERLPGQCARLRDDPASSDLPPRVSVFGPTRLTTAQLEVLQALAHAREVHLWLPHPSPALWDAVARGPRPVRRRGADSVAAHPLLASMARDSRELQQRLPGAEGATDTWHPVPDVRRTLLARLQDGVRHDRPPGAGTPVEPDGSVQVHACHGPARQVEVLREVLLGLFAGDPTLEPRDVLVLCPDVEAFAPLVLAGFGLGAEGRHPGHGLRVQLADRGLRQTNPLLDVVARLLDLADGRVTASEVLDLLATPGVRRRAGLDGDDLERVRGWVAGTGTRWGLDLEHRARWQIGTEEGTWRAGLDRLLLGVAASEDDLPLLGGVLPLDDVDSGDIGLVGRLADTVARLDEVLASLREPQPATAWAEALARGLDLLTDTPERDAWQAAQARRELAEAAGGSSVVLSLADARAMLADRLRGRPTRASFRTGSLTVCTMVPMRSVPHRVVALLGMDDGAFPRSTTVDGDDVLLRDPCVGERDRRSEDRQLFLDAVLSATEHLVVLHTGADPLSGAPRPPAVPVGELLDVLDATCGPAGREQVVVRHPLQPFDPRGFAPGALVGGRAFSFDRSALAGALRAAGDRVPPAPLLRGPLPVQGGDVRLTDLGALLEHPSKAFLRQRLQVAVPGEEDEVADGLRVRLDPLQAYDVGDRMLAARLRGVATGTSRQAEQRRGTLPPGRLGARELDDLEPVVEALARAVEERRAGPARAVDVDVDLGGGRRLQGTVPGVHGRQVVRGLYSRLGPKHRLRAWVHLLALAAGDEQGWTAVTTGRRPYGSGPATSVLTPPAEPLAVLRALVDLFDQGLSAPLPAPPRTACAYARSRHHDGGSHDMALLDADKAWQDERDDPHHALALPAGPTADPRFAELALAVWVPLLEAEA